jgi:hypothetical protein
VAHHPIWRHRVVPVQEPPESRGEADPAHPMPVRMARARAYPAELLGDLRAAMVRGPPLRRQVEQHHFLLNRTSARRLRTTVLV